MSVMIRRNYKAEKLMIEVLTPFEYQLNFKITLHCICIHFKFMYVKIFYIKRLLYEYTQVKTQEKMEILKK